MSIERSNVVDFVALDSDTGNLVLTISDHLDWPDDASEHLLLLQDKLNAYLRFIESGEDLQSHSNAQGRPILIDVILKYPASGQGVRFFEEVRKVIEGAGIMFRYRLFQDDAA